MKNKTVISLGKEKNMSIEEFKEYLDMVVEKAFKMGVVWERNGSDLENMEESIKNAQKVILENG